MAGGSLKSIEANGEGISPKKSLDVTPHELVLVLGRSFSPRDPCGFLMEFNGWSRERHNRSVGGLKFIFSKEGNRPQFRIYHFGQKIQLRAPSKLGETNITFPIFSAMDYDAPTYHATSIHAGNKEIIRALEDDPRTALHAKYLKDNPGMYVVGS